jgi:hypothetical protein
LERLVPALSLPAANRVQKSPIRKADLELQLIPWILTV